MYNHSLLSSKKNDFYFLPHLSIHNIFTSHHHHIFFQFFNISTFQPHTMNQQQLHSICDLTLQRLNLTFSKDTYFHKKDVPRDMDNIFYHKIVDWMFPHILTKCMEQYFTLPLQCTFQKWDVLEKTMSLICGESICKIITIMTYFRTDSYDDTHTYASDPFAILIDFYLKEERDILLRLFKEQINDELISIRDQTIDISCHPDFKHVFRNSPLFSLSDSIFTYFIDDFSKTFDRETFLLTHEDD